MEMGYSRPQRKAIMHGYQTRRDQRDQIPYLKLCQHTNLLPEAKEAEGKPQPLAVQGIIYFREALNAQDWMGSLSEARSLYHEAMGAEDDCHVNATGPDCTKRRIVCT